MQAIALKKAEIDVKETNSVVPLIASSLFCDLLVEEYRQL